MTLDLEPIRDRRAKVDSLLKARMYGLDDFDNALRASSNDVPDLLREVEALRAELQEQGGAR